MTKTPRRSQSAARAALACVALVVLIRPTPIHAGLTALQNAEAHFAAGEFTAAETLFQAAIPSLTQPYLLERLVALYLQWNRPVEGLAVWQTLPAGDPRLHLDLLTATGNWVAAEEVARQMLRDADDKGMAYTQLTRALLYQSRCQEAQNVAIAWATERDEDSQAIQTAAVLNLAMQSADLDVRALDLNEELQDVLLHCTHEAECLRQAGETLLRQKTPTLAACVLSRAVDLEPNDAYTHAWLGAALEQLGNTDMAIPHFKQATQIAPDEPLGWLLLGMAQFNTDKVPEAKLSLLRAQNLDPESPLPCLAVAAVLAAQSNYRDIPTWTYAALDRATADPDIWKSVARFYLSRNLMLQGEPANAAEGAVRLAPQDAESWTLLGWARLNTGDFDEAIQALERAISYDEQQAEAHHLLGLTLRALGRSTEADLALIRAQDLGYGF